MKRSLIRSLLALLLVVNPVAVLASDFHDLKIQVNQTTEEVPCHPVEQQERHSEPPQHDNTNCDMPCCEDSECSEQGICLIHYNSDVVAQKTLKFYHPIKQRGWDASVAEVPDRKLPPENPPPIHL